MDLAAGDDPHSQPIEKVLSFPIILSDQILRAADDAKSYKLESSELSKLVDHLSKMLRSFVRLTDSTTSSFYDRPVRRVFSDVSRTLSRALSLLRKCRRRSIFLRLVTIASLSEFKKVSTCLEACIGDMKWLLSIFENESGVVLSLPPIASNDPILAWVWAYIASLYSTPLTVKTEVANELCSLAKDNHRNKKLITQEGGIPPLLKLLKEDLSNPEAQIAAATTLYNLADDEGRSRMIAGENGVPVVVQALQKGSTKVQIAVAKLVGKMAEFDAVSQEAFARENVVRSVVTLLSFDFVESQYESQYEKQSIHSIVKIKKTGSIVNGQTPSMWSINRKERENESSELKLELKTSCSRALWMLVKDNLANCKIVTDTKGLLVLAKLIETEPEASELQINCLMTVMEISAAAESNPDLRRAAFRTNSPAAKAVVDQLLNLIHNARESNININWITIPAIKSIGSLARTFPARETRVISPLVEQLGNRDADVAREAVIALGKFASPDNFLCKEHSKTIIEHKGVNPLMRLLRHDDRTQHHALVLLCYLALHAGNNEEIMQARLLTVLEGADKSRFSQDLRLKQLVEEAVYQLKMYHAGVIPSKKVSYSP